MNNDFFCTITSYNCNAKRCVQLIWTPDELDNTKAMYELIDNLKPKYSDL